MAKFIKSAAQEKDWIKDSKKEICFIGRSNVGKSTLINTLANQKIAKTSNTPGRTQLVNFFDFGNYRLVDLPGYGFARASKAKRDDLQDIIDEFICNRENLVAVFQICDCSVITQQDVEVSEYLSSLHENHFIILNKLDKQNKSFYDNNKNKISKYLNKDLENIYPISCKERTNINKLNALITKLIQGK